MEIFKKQAVYKILPQSFYPQEKKGLITTEAIEAELQKIQGGSEK